jgi:hypothetical protein
MPVGCDRIRPDVAGEDHLKASTVKPQAQTARTGEEIDS